MQLQTKHFGEIQYQQNDIIHFDEGLPAFEHIKQYILILNPNPEMPFHWLQAIDDPDLAFVITNPFLFKQDYDFELPKKVIQQLELGKKQDVQVYTIAVVPEDLKKMTINLRGPIILNKEKKKGRQVILDQEDYPVKYYIFEEVTQTASGLEG